MMTKFVEIRDRGTLVPGLAIQISEADGWLARRAGFGENSCVLLINLARVQCEYDPYVLVNNRTMHVAHLWLSEHWDEHQDGAVVDVEFVLGKSMQPKCS